MNENYNNFIHTDHKQKIDYGVEDFKEIPKIFDDLNKHYFCIDRFGKIFSSPTNAFSIHREISKQLFNLYQVWIPKQEDTEFAQILSNAYRDFMNINRKTGNDETDLYNLNVSVIEATIPIMISNIELSKKRLNIIDKIPTPITLPQAMNTKGIDGRSVHDLSQFFTPIGYFPYKRNSCP